MRMEVFLINAGKSVRVAWWAQELGVSGNGLAWSYCCRWAAGGSGRCVCQSKRDEAHPLPPNYDSYHTDFRP